MCFLIGESPMFVHMAQLIVTSVALLDAALNL